MSRLSWLRRKLSKWQTNQDADGHSLDNQLTSNFRTSGVIHQDNWPFGALKQTFYEFPQVRPHPEVNNPIIDTSTINNETSVTSNTGGADPFLVQEPDGGLGMFYEIKDGGGSGQDIIGYASMTAGHPDYSTMQVVLETTDELSFPQVWREDGQWYMIPNLQGTAERVDLFVTSDSNYPGGWSKDSTILTGNPLSDPVFFHLPDLSGEPFATSNLTWDGTHYIIVGDESSSPTKLRLYYSSDLKTGWSEHPSSPVLNQDEYTRGGGRAIITPGQVYVPYQDVRDASPVDAVSVMQIKSLSQSTFEKNLVHRIIQGRLDGNWHSQAMHHMDANLGIFGPQYPIAVDGYTDGGEWRIGLYQNGTPIVIGSAEVGATTLINASNTILNLADILNDWEHAFDLANNQLVIPSSGVYELWGRLRYNINDTGVASGVMIMSIHDVTNSTQIAPYQYTQITKNDDYTGKIKTGPVFLEEGAKIELQAYNDTGTDLGLDSGGNKCRFEYEKK